MTQSTIARYGYAARISGLLSFVRFAHPAKFGFSEPTATVNLSSIGAVSRQAGGRLY